MQLAMETMWATHKKKQGFTHRCGTYWPTSTRRKGERRNCAAYAATRDRNGIVENTRTTGSVGVGGTNEAGKQEEKDVRKHGLVSCGTPESVSFFSVQGIQPYERAVLTTGLYEREEHC